MTIASSVSSRADSTDSEFSAEQKRYLEGFAAGSGLHTLNVVPTFASTLGVTVGPKPRGTDYAPAPEEIHLLAQDRFLQEGKKLTPEEVAKRKMNGLDVWDKLIEHAREDRFPKGTDVFMIKFLGMFYVAPAQNAFMCRLRFAGGMCSTAQFRGVADLARDYGGGYADCTTRANLQIRQIKAKHAPDVLMGLYDLGIVNRGAGADNIRNITGTPTAGIDPQELIDTRALCKQQHHYILNHREMYGLPRKFNIAFDGAGTISALEDTNDIGFTAVKVAQGKGIPEGVYFRLTLGGITGHKDFARDTGVLLKPDECIAVSAAIVKAFIALGDRTDRRKARLKYVLDRMGFDGFLHEVEKHYNAELLRFRSINVKRDQRQISAGILAFIRRKQPGLFYVGVVLPVGRMACEQMHALADIADKHGSGTIRLTVWQNLLISDIPEAKLETVKAELDAIGLGVEATHVRGGLVACTGNAGCKFAAANTKAHAMQIVQHLEHTLELDVPVNIHLTGCHNSCAQHFIGDIGLIGTKVPVGEQDVEGYNIFVGGGYGPEAGIGREMYREVAAADCPLVVERMLRGYLEHRTAPSQSFLEMVRDHSTDELKIMFQEREAGKRMSSFPVPVLPDSAPFNPSQRAWLNGFFAGLVSTRNGTTHIDVSGHAPGANGSNGTTGNNGVITPAPGAAAEAKDAAAAAPETEEDMPWHDPALAINERMALVESKPFPRKLMGAMAQLDCGACGYLCQTYAEAIASGAEPDLTRCAPGGRETSKKLKELIAKGGSSGSAPSLVTTEGAAVKKVPATPVSGKYDRNHPFPARLLKNSKLNGEQSAKDTRFVSFDLKGSGLDYIVGDALGIIPENCIDNVEWILDALDLSGAEDVPGTDGQPSSLLEALHRQRTITTVSDNLLELLADHASNAEEASALRAMLSGDGAPAGLEVLDLLLKFPSARPPADQFVAALTPIAPRLYSIASSRAAHPDEVHLTVGIVRYLNCEGRQCKGVASTYLADRLRPGMRVRVFLQTSHGFRLPADPTKPIIMVGPGTGIAPFRAFLQERHASGAKGGNWLFFGDQHESHDYLYRNEIEGWLAAGTLTRVDTAFSRDSDQKLYVQHRMLEHGQELWNWLSSGAYFYVCGDAKRMAKDVDNTLKKVVSQFGNMDEAAASEYVSTMSKEKRYLRDVY